MYDQQQGMQSFSTGYVFPDRLEQQSKMREPVGDDFFFNRDHGSSGSFLRKPQPLCRMVGYNVTHLNCLPCFPQQQSQTPPLPLIDRDIQPGRRTSCGDFLSAESTFRFPPQMQNANNVVPGSLELNQGVTLGHRALSFVRGDPPMEQASKQADDQMADFKVTCFVHEQDGSDLRQTWCQPSDQVITNLPSSGPAQASRHHCLGPAPKRTYPYSTTTFESGGESNRPAHHISTSGRRRELAPKKGRRHMIPKRTAQAVLSNVVSQRKSHIWSERQRRRSMNQLYTTMRALLPHQSVKTDKSTVVLDIVNYIRTLQAELEMLSRRRDRLVTTRNLHQKSSQAFSAHGLTCVDHTSDASVLTAVTTLPPPGSASCLASFLGNNVAIHICGHHLFVTITAPAQLCLLTHIIATLDSYNLNVLSIAVNSRDNTTAYSLSVEASQVAEAIGDDLHTALQIVINNFSSSEIEAA
ncbi:uncharacterized protein [Physcomitrium patens]|uniref:BHLH domain-containing protein n=1 Tax=Physcomitrium patens TaxID=3218 RepID=A0A2K1L7M7_PHYPA|nr:uncharacterized protein LOC112281865 [Physcomitrium patens]XP_024374604.1 uncharacterized protein LOC112281865 [Physcomitrium patens]XP_024374613.1 uncharacterized protein LOC112281865 [Physcomitrium patens]PNR61991.1 hypothetical protein PHYPA_000415 [Physcomitrium patens]|eukprot:XP_024374595.1 uncharacterized protein LOC112281865 [Physcomitrella patens]